jgi:uncharacterized protein YegP (UPF0339 family)
MAEPKDSFEVYQDKREEWRWRQMSADGKVVGAATEGYKAKSDCEANMKRGAKASDKWEFYTDKRGQHRWRQKASNGQVVGAGPSGYKTEAEAKAGAARRGYK